jgi:hypothetical protein
MRFSRNASIGLTLILFAGAAFAFYRYDHNRRASEAQNRVSSSSNVSHETREQDHGSHKKPHVEPHGGGDNSGRSDQDNSANQKPPAGEHNKTPDSKFGGPVGPVGQQPPPPESEPPISAYTGDNQDNTQKHPVSSNSDNASNGNNKPLNASVIGPRVRHIPKQKHDPKKVHLVFDDATLTDASRASLIQLIASDRPVEKWKIVTIAQEGESLSHFVERNYGIANSLNPASYSALVGLIRNANNGVDSEIQGGIKIKAPPVPFHQSQTANKHGLLRFQNVENKLIGIRSLLEMESTQAASSGPPSAFGTTTVIQLARPERLIDLAWTSLRAILPEGVRATSDRTFSTIHLLNAPDNLGPCLDNPEDWLKSSPFWTAAKSRLAGLTSSPESHQRIIQNAKQHPFVILDWDYQDNQHGHKVEAVVHDVLAEAGLADLPIEFVELNARTNKDKLKGIVNEFKAGEYCPGHCNEDQESDIAKALDWITDPDKQEKKAELPPPGKTEIRVKELVLQAVFWKYFKATDKAWINMSFSVDQGSLDLVQAKIFNPSSSFGVAAAADDSVVESVQGIPQRAAATYVNFVNITSGGKDGAWLRGFANQKHAIPVSIMGPDCGFQYADGDIKIEKDERGTSFASPYVALWSWIKFLLDGDDAHMLRNDLVQSSDIPATQKPLPIESLGVFDPARLLTLQKPAKPYIMSTDGSITLLRSGTLTLQFMKVAPTITSLPFSAQTDPNTLIVVFQTPGTSPLARIRKLKTDSLPVASDPEDYALQDLSFNGDTENGDHLDAPNLAIFVSKYKEINF